MLKLRAMGTTNDLKWFKKIIDRYDVFHVIRMSEPLTMKGTNKYYRMYIELDHIPVYVGCTDPVCDTDKPGVGNDWDKLCKRDHGSGIPGIFHHGMRRHLCGDRNGCSFFRRQFHAVFCVVAGGSSHDRFVLRIV